MTEIPQKPESKRGKFFYFIWSNMPRFILLALVLLIIIAFSAVKEKSANVAAQKENAIAKDKPPVNIVTLPLQTRTITDRINLPGNIEPWTELMFLAKIDGTIDEVLVTEGDQVKKGDIIAKVDNSDFRIAVDRALAAYNLAQADYERDQSVHKQGLLPVAEIEARRTQLQTAKSDLEQAELLLSRCTIEAPMEGVIDTLYAKVGLRLSTGDPVAMILQTKRMKAVIGIPESDVSAVRSLDAVDLTIKALNNREIKGKKHFLAPSPGSIAMLYNLELALDNSDGEILSGMFVRADIIKKSVPDAVAIPFYSVISRNNEQFVYIEQDGVVEKRNVVLGVMEQWMVEVTDGLQPGENLVVEGHRDVEDGQNVRVVKSISSPEEILL